MADVNNWNAVDSSYQSYNDSTYGKVIQITSSGEGIWKFLTESNITGNKYSWSVYLRASGPVSVSVGTEDGGIQQVSLATTWQLFKNEGYTSNGVNNGNFHVYYSDTTVNVYVYHPKVEQGTKATSWSPAPEDVDNSISTAQNAAQTYATDNCVTTDGNNAPSSIKNSNVSIGSDGTLNNAGGGKVTIGGLGYTGALDATKGATWGTDLINIPSELGTPSAPGLYLTSTSMGYWDGSAFKTYMDKFGNMELGDPANAKGLSWNQSTGDLVISRIS